MAWALRAGAAGRALAALFVSFTVLHPARGEPAGSGPSVLVRRLGLTGALRFDEFESSSSFDDATALPGLTAQLVARPALSDHLDGRVFARFGNTAIGRGGAATGVLVEGYGTWHFATSDLRVGKQIVAWGRADGINPTDNLTPRDLSILLPFEDDQRLGLPALRWDWFASPERTLTMVATPFFEGSVIPWPREGPARADVTPPRTPADMPIGLRWNQVGDGFDGSVSYYHGFAMLPSLVPQDAAGSRVQARHDRIQVIGADFARNFGRFGIRGEVAYTRTRDGAGTDPFVRNPQLYGVLGVDRTFFDNLNLNLQVFQRWVQAYADPRGIGDPARRAWAIQSALLAGQLDRFNDGLTFRVADKWLHDTLEAEVFGEYDAGTHDAFLRPLLTYSFTDQWKATLGAELFYGAPSTPFGSQVRNRGAFLEVRDSF